MTQQPDSTSPQRRHGIDPRGPRFAAWITSALLLVATFLALIEGPAEPAATLAERISEPGFLVLGVIGVLFAWGFTFPATAPWGLLYRKVVQPRLAPPQEFEDPRPPRFAQVVGFMVVLTGLLLHMAGVPWALTAAAAAAFVAAFLNAAFAFCLGCHMYVGLIRTGILRPQTA